MRVASRPKLERLGSRLSATQAAGAAAAWRALWTSRLAVWLAGIYGMLAVGYRPTGGAPHTGAPLGSLGELLFGGAARWDATFYLSIAEHSYHAGTVTAFFPLYPLTIAGANTVVGSALMSGILVSLAALAVGLYLLYRLAALELGERHARTTVLVLAFFPTSLFFSADYPEALLLALTVGAVYAARTGHWAWAGVAGALASATHNSGVLVAIPIVLLYLYGPRADRDLVAPEAGRSRCGRSRWLPRYKPRLDMLWVLLAPLGLIAFLAYMGVEFGDALRPLHVNNTLWHRHFEPLGGLIHLPHVLWHDLERAGSAPPGELFPATNGPYRGAAANFVDVGALILAVAATVGVVRRLPSAYSAYTIVALVVYASAPKSHEPLLSLPRFVLVLFPVQMAIARWADQRPGRRAAWLGCSGVALGVLSLQFATGRWVA